MKANLVISKAFGAMITLRYIKSIHDNRVKHIIYIFLIDISLIISLNIVITLY